jgi:hypothetical protein
MTIGGSFQAKTNSIAGSLSASAASPTALDGEISVDLRTLDSGIGLRNTHMRDRYLEAGKGQGFDKAILSEISLGSGSAATVEGRTPFNGMLLLHGVRKTVSGGAEIRRTTSAVRIEASFPVTLTDFDIQKPQYLGVGVREEVQVRVSLELASGDKAQEAR